MLQILMQMGSFIDAKKAFGVFFPMIRQGRLSFSRKTPEKMVQGIEPPEAFRVPRSIRMAFSWQVKNSRFRQNILISACGMK